MTNRLPIVVTMVIGMPILALLVPGCGSKEPEYQGKTVTAWVTALEDPSPDVANTAWNLVGTEALKDKKVMAVLILGMKNGNYAAADLMGEIAHDTPDPMKPDMVQAMADTVKNKGSNISVRLAAAKALPRFGPAAGPAIPALIEMLKDDTNYTLRERAAESIGQMPANLAQQATQALLAAAKTDTTPSVQFKALEALRAIDPEALKRAGGN